MLSPSTREFSIGLPISDVLQGFLLAHPDAEVEIRTESQSLIGTYDATTHSIYLTKTATMVQVVPSNVFHIDANTFYVKSWCGPKHCYTVYIDGKPVPTEKVLSYVTDESDVTPRSKPVRNVQNVLDCSTAHVESEAQLNQLAWYAIVRDEEWGEAIINMARMGEIEDDPLVGEPAKIILRKFCAEGHPYVWFSPTVPAYDDLPIYDW